MIEFTNTKCTCKIDDIWDPGYTVDQIKLFKKNVNIKHTCKYTLLYTMNHEKTYHCCLCNKRYITDPVKGINHFQEIYKPQLHKKLNLRRKI
jgi:hypothetical protein